MSGAWQPFPDEIKAYVFQGVWKRHDKQLSHSLIWTLSNFSALIVVAWLTCLIALAQSQCWTIVRYIIAQHTKPVRLPDDADDPDDSKLDPLLELSQSKAIESVIPLLSGWASRLVDRIRGLFRIKCRRPARSPRPPDDDPVESPFFGLAAILNICFFLVMQFLIPYWLTEGVLGAPIVKSRLTEECRYSSQTHLWDEVNRETRADEIFHLCRDRLNTGCDSPYYLSEPKITKSRLETCPFGGSICINGTAPFQITHWNISAFEIGVNSKSKLLVNHRLTCAPVSLDPFLYNATDERSFIYVLQSIPNGRFTLSSNVSLILATKNGPNKLSDESSGLKVFEDKGPFDLTVLPRFSPPTAYYLHNRPALELHEALQRDDGESFLIVYRAGDKYYAEVIDDPFFSAHNTGFQNPELVYADAEATALGCVEQFQYCFPPNPLLPCTNWGPHISPVTKMLTDLQSQYKSSYAGIVNASMMEHWNNQLGLSYSEIYASLGAVPGRFGVYDYLTLRISMNWMVPLIERKSVSKDLRWVDDTKEQWPLEVETWFMKAWLSGLLSVQDGALYMFTGIGPGFSDKYLREWLLCGRILFHAQDYTNLNWIGFWVSVACLTLLCLMGSYAGAKFDILEAASRVLEEWKFWRTLSTFWGQLPIWRDHHSTPTQHAGGFINLPVNVGNISFLFQSFNRRRPWYSGGSGADGSGRGSFPDVATSVGTEMEDLEVPPSTALDGDGHGSGDTEEPFWYSVINTTKKALPDKTHFILKERVESKQDGYEIFAASHGRASAMAAILTFSLTLIKSKERPRWPHNLAYQWGRPIFWPQGSANLQVGMTSAASSHESKRSEARNLIAKCNLIWETDGRTSVDAEAKGGKRTRRLRVYWNHPDLKQYESYLVLAAPPSYNNSDVDYRGLLNKETEFLGRCFGRTENKRNLIRELLRLCKRYHDDRYTRKLGIEDDFYETLVEPYFGVIDIENDSLVSLPFEENGDHLEFQSYASASYVWGKDGSREHVTNMANIQSRRKSGGLASVIKKLPNAFWKAIRLVQTLGIRYIWIDSIYIVQDSSHSWNLNARAMHLIYGNSIYILSKGRMYKRG